MAFITAENDTTAELAAIDQALATNKRLSDHLRACSEDMLEKWLRAHCEEYRLGLAAGRYSGDWEKALDRFKENAREFIVVLGAARNMASSGYDRARGVFSPAAYEAISHAHGIAIKIEAEIAAINSIAMEHDKMVGRTVFNDPMPRLVLEPYAAVVAQIASLPAMVAQAEFNRVIAAVEDLIHRELGLMRARVREAAGQHLGRTESYVRHAWNLLHEHALAHSIEPEHVNTVVAQTAQTYREVLEATMALA